MPIVFRPEDAKPGDIWISAPEVQEDDIWYVYKGGAKKPLPGRDNIICKSGAPKGKTMAETFAEACRESLVDWWADRHGENFGGRVDYSDVFMWWFCTVAVGVIALSVLSGVVMLYALVLNNAIYGAIQLLGWRAAMTDVGFISLLAICLTILGSVGMVVRAVYQLKLARLKLEARELDDKLLTEAKRANHY